MAYDIFGTDETLQIQIRGIVQLLNQSRYGKSNLP